MGKEYQTDRSSPDWHPSDDELLLHVDGELLPKEGEELRRHLEACWSCRVRAEKVQETISLFVDYRNELLIPTIEPPRHWNYFDTKLHQVVTRMGRRPLAVVLRGAFEKLFFQHRALTVAASSALALFMVALWLAKSPHVPAVSASELLVRAEQSRSDSLHAVSQPVLHEKVSIQVGQKRVTREIWRDTVHNRQKDDWDRGDKTESRQPGSAASAPESDLPKLFAANHLFWNDPLSPTGYAAWRAAAGPVTEEVVSHGANEWTVKTSVRRESITTGKSANGNAGDRIVAASLTVRASDFHPLSERFEVQAASLERTSRYEVNVAELNYAVLTADSLRPDFFSPEPVLSSSAAEPVIPAKPAIVSGPSLAELTDGEVAARYALHRIGADLSNQIHFTIQTQDKQSLVAVQGLVDSEEQKTEVLQALSDLPHVKADLQTAEELIAQKPPVVSADANAASATDSNRVSPHSPIEQQLLAYWGNSTAVESFSERAFSLTESLMAHAWALRNIEERYPGLKSTAASPLSSSSRELLETMERDHRSAMHDEVAELQASLKPILVSIANAAPAAPDQASLFDNAQQVKQLTLHLLFGTALPDSSVENQPGNEARNLLERLISLESQLK